MQTTEVPKIIMELIYIFAGTTVVGTGGPLVMKSHHYAWDRG